MKEINIYPKPFSWEGSTPVLFRIRRSIFELKSFTIPLYPSCVQTKPKALFPRKH